MIKKNEVFRITLMKSYSIMDEKTEKLIINEWYVVMK